MATFWAPVLCPGRYQGQFQQISDNYEPADLQALAENGSSLAKKGIKAPLPRAHRDANKKLPRPILLDDSGTAVDARTNALPDWDVRLNEGFVSDWKYLDTDEAELPEGMTAEFAAQNKGWLAARLDIPEENTDIIDAIRQKRLRATSLGSVRNYRVPGEPETQLNGPTPIHLALTLSPKVPNQGDLEEVQYPELLSDDFSQQVVLLSDNDMAEIALLSEDPPVKPAAKPEAPEQNPEKQVPADGAQDLAGLLEAAKASGMFNLPPDTSPENVVDRIITLLHNLKGGTEDDPLGEPPEDSEAIETPAETLSEDMDSLTKSLLSSAKKSHVASLRQRADAIAKKNLLPKDKFDALIGSKLEALDPAVLLDDSGAAVLDPETEAPKFETTELDLALSALEAATPPDSITGETPETEALGLPDDVHLEHDTEASKKRVKELLQQVS